MTKKIPQTDVAARQTASPAVVLACKADVIMSESQRDALCRSLYAALVGRVGADRLRFGAETDSPAAGTLRITLHLTRAETRIIEGHLEWRDGADPVMTGPPVVLSVDDMSLGPSLYPPFAAGLLQVSKLPL